MIVKLFREYLKWILVISILLLLCNFTAFLEIISRVSNTKDQIKCLQKMPKNVEINPRHWINFISKNRIYFLGMGSGSAVEPQTATAKPQPQPLRFRACG